MVFDVVHPAGIKHQAADALPRLSTTGEDRTLINDAVQVMIFLDSPKGHEKVGIKTTNVSDGYDDIGI